MSVSPRPNLLRAATQSKALLLVLPAIAALAALVWIGRSAVTTPAAVAPVEAVTAVVPPAQAETAAVPAPEPVKAAEKPAETATFSPEQKQQIEQIIKSYLVANPEIFVDVQNALEAKMEKEQAEKLKVAISENAAEIYREPNASVGGNPDGDITVVEFFDYNCGYCKRGLHDVVKLIDTDPKVRVVFKELPILSKGSEEASRVALAARMQGKYWDLHRAMLTAKGQMNEATALQLAEKLGLDINKLKQDMASPEVKTEVEKSEALAKKMGVNGTPHFLVGDRAIAGAPEDLYDQLARHVGELRKQGCSYC
jgi:protein-disulfide isomerase